MHDGQWDMNSWELQRTFRVCLYIAKHWVVVAALLLEAAVAVLLLLRLSLLQRLHVLDRPDHLVKDDLS